VSAWVGYQITDATQREANEQIANARADAARAMERTALLEKEAQTARERAALLERVTETVRSEAAEANARAAEANVKAEAERLARIKIEERLADRKLTPAQMKELTEKLGRFSGQKLNIVAVSNDPEIVRITNALITAVREANWIFETGVGGSGGRAVYGILIEVDRDADEITRAAAQALAVALTDQNLVTVGPMPSDPNAMAGSFFGKILRDAKLRLTVGRK
jgi:hypothetical protein